MSNPKVSVLSLAYNHAPYADQTLTSIRQQTFEDWELLVLDDGSTDTTWDILQAHAKEDSRIQAFTQKNRGRLHIADNVNFMLEKTKATLVTTIATDDYWPLDRLEKQYPSHATNKDLILSYGRVSVFNSRGILKDYPRPPQTGLFDSNEVLRWLLTMQSSIQPVSVMINKEALHKVGGFQQLKNYPVEDYPTYLSLLALPGQVQYLDTLLGYWRVSDKQLTQAFLTDVPEAAFHSATSYYDSLSVQERNALALSKKDILNAHYSKTLLPSYLSAMRKALLQKDKPKAKHFALELIRHGDSKRKVQGLLGGVAAQFGWNLEAVFASYESLGNERVKGLA
jgi:Glycosyl transferase family 2